MEQGRLMYEKQVVKQKSNSFIPAMRIVMNSAKGMWKKIKSPQFI